MAVGTDGSGCRWHWVQVAVGAGGSGRRWQWVQVAVVQVRDGEHHAQAL